MNALIIIDLQNNFCDGGALTVVGGSKVLTGSHHVVSAVHYVARGRVETQDAHAGSLNWRRLTNLMRMFPFQ